MVSDVLTIGPCVLSVFLFLVFIYELVTSAQKYAKCLYNFSMVKINKILYSFFSFVLPSKQLVTAIGLVELYALVTSTVHRVKEIH